MAARLKKDDLVQVISGDHKGSRGKVLRVIVEKDRVVVEGVNMVYRHMRKSRKFPNGGRIQREAPIHASKVMPVDPKTGKPTRVRFTVETDKAGHITKKTRISTAGTVLSEATRHKRAAGAK